MINRTSKDLKVQALMPSQIELGKTKMYPLLDRLGSQGIGEYNIIRCLLRFILIGIASVADFIIR